MKYLKNVKSKRSAFTSIFMVFVLTCLSISGVFSYFTASSSKGGDIDFAVVEVNIIKEGETLTNSQFTYSYLDNLQPGSKINITSAEVKNTGSVDCYVLLSFSITITKSDETSLFYNTWYSFATKSSTGDIELGESNFEDRYKYSCNEVYTTNMALNDVGATLLKADTTAIIDISYALPGDALGNQYQGANVRVDLVAYGIQTLLPEASVYQDKALYASYKIITDCEAIYSDSSIIDGTYNPSSETTSAAKIYTPLRSLDIKTDNIDYASNQIIRNVGRIEITEDMVTIDPYYNENFYENIVYACIPKPINDLNYGEFVSNTRYLTGKNSSTVGGGWDNAGNIGCFASSATRYHYWVGYAKGTTLEEMKVDLIGRVLYYQHVTPEYETYLNTGKNLWNLSTNNLKYKTGASDNTAPNPSSNYDLSGIDAQILSQYIFTLSCMIRRHVDDNASSVRIAISYYYTDGSETYTNFGFLNNIPNDGKWHYVYVNNRNMSFENLDYIKFWVADYGTCTYRNYEIKNIQLEIGRSSTDYESSISGENFLYGNLQISSTVTEGIITNDSVHALGNAYVGSGTWYRGWATNREMFLKAGTYHFTCDIELLENPNNMSFPLSLRMAFPIYSSALNTVSRVVKKSAVILSSVGDKQSMSFTWIIGQDIEVPAAYFFWEFESCRISYTNMNLVRIR